MSPKILIADDDPVQRRLLETLVHQFGYQAETVESGEAVLARLQASSAAPVDLVILDLVMPNLDGMAVLSRLRERGAKLPIIVQTSPASVESAVPAMRLGAHDFVVKPVGPERLQVAIKNALAADRLAEEVSFLTRRAFGTLAIQGPRGRQRGNGSRRPAGRKGGKIRHPRASRRRAWHRQGNFRARDPRGFRPPRRRVRDFQLRRLRRTISNGCCLAAKRGRFPAPPEKTLANASRRGAARFFSTGSANCRLRRRGGFCASFKRARLHRAGAKRPVKADIRLIFAANRNLIEQVKRGGFRDDLYYRINVFPISIPPLRARRDDIASLARRFCARFAATEGKPVHGICAEALALLGAYDWPGNVRQLENAVFRAVVLADGGELTVAEFPQIAARVEGFDVRVPAAPVNRPPRAARAKKSSFGWRCVIPMFWRSSTRTATRAISIDWKPKR